MTARAAAGAVFGDVTAGGAAAAVLVAVLAGACGARPASPVVVVGAGRSVSASHPEVDSNVLRSDYVGSAACAACHGDVYAAWNRSPMHRMTRLPEPGDVRAPFDGRELRFKNDSARLQQVDGVRFMHIRSVVPPASSTSTSTSTFTSTSQVYRVTRVIGGRYREDFAGLEVAAADPAARLVGDVRQELILPVSYVIDTGELRLKGYSVMVRERPGLRAGGVWNQTCIFCHNTVPYLDDLLGALHGPGAPGYQGEVVDRALPEDRRLAYRVTDGAALVRALDDGVAALGGPAGAATAALAAGGGGGEAAAGGVRPALRRAILEARARYQPRHFVELGVGCEACHGGGRQHADDPRHLPTFAPRAAFLRVGSAAGGPEPSAAEWQNRACARCHQVLFSRYPHTWEGGMRRSPGGGGGSHITSGEARDFLLGACARAMACSTCHDPHGEDRRETLARLATPAGNGVCTGCHRQLAAPPALRVHAHHDPAGAGGSCVACHMPKKNMGLGYALTRYHRIGSPTDRARVEGDRPLECALCHAERSVGTLLADIERLWGKRYDDAAIRRLYGGPEANVLMATIARGLPHEQAAAIGAAGERGFRPAAAAITGALTHDYPLVRYYARAALEALTGVRPAVPDWGTPPAAGPGRGGAAAEEED